MRCYKLFILIMLITSCKTHQTELNFQQKELTKLCMGAKGKTSAVFNLDIFDTIIYHTLGDTTQTNDYKKPKSAIITRHLKAEKKEIKETQNYNKKEELKESQCVNKKGELKKAPSGNKKGKKGKKKQIEKSSKKSSIIPYTIIIIFLIFVAYVKRKH